MLYKVAIYARKMLIRFASVAHVRKHLCQRLFTILSHKLSAILASLFLGIYL